MQQPHNSNLSRYAKRSKSLAITMVLIFTSAFHLLAQNTVIKGQVLDDKNRLALEGVSIQVTNSKIGTTTNTLGEFSLLSNDAFPQSLEISYTGFEKKSVTLQSNEFLTIYLKEEAKEISEVLVRSSYNVQKKSEFAGAVSNIDVRSLENRPASSFDQLLGGHATGVDIIQPSSVLNNTPIMRIRGINTITSGLFPLVIVDGVSVFVGSIGGLIGNNPLSDINPNDIQNIDILKDASAAALYGSRAANGVMVITTKKGQKGRVKVNYSNWLSRSTPYNLPELLNAEEYTMIKNEAMVNSGRAPGYQLMKNADGSTVNTSWYDVAFRPGISHNHTLSVSGANNATKYFFSAGFTDQNSYIRYNNFKRYSSRINIENQVNKAIVVGANVNLSNSQNTGPNTGAIASNSLSSSSYNSNYITNEPQGRMTYVLPPNVPVYREDGSYSIQNGVSVGYGANALSIGTINAYNLAMVQKLDVNTSENLSIIGNVFAELSLLKNLKLRTNYGINRLQVENKSFLNPIHGGGASANGSASNTNGKYIRSELVNTLKYDLNFNDAHHINLLLGNEIIKNKIDIWGAQRSNITDPYYENYQGGFINIVPTGNVISETAILSYFSGLNYDYLKKYLLSVNVRRDGLSALAKGNKWGNFYGASAGWNLSKESFIKNLDIEKYISDFKLRASYGLVGNSEIGDYPSIGAFSSNTYGGLPVLYYAQAANPNLKWETSKKLDIGCNFSILKGRMNVEFDYYKNVIDGLILKSPQSLSAGIPGNFINANVGSMYNRGIELGIQADIIQTKTFQYQVGFNFSTLKNEVTALVSDVYVPSIFGVQNMTRVGYSVGSIFAVPTKGVNPDNGLMVFINSEGREVQYNHIGSPRWTYLDGSAAPAIDNYKDGVIQGPSLPTYFGGLNQEFRYKNFGLQVNLTYSGGNYLYNGTRATNSDQRYFNNGKFILNRWTTPGQKTDIQKLQYGDNVSAGFSFAATSKVEKGDYLKLKTLTLSYDFPVNHYRFANRISNLRAYIQGTNLYTLTKYRGSDPEVSINGNSIHSGKDQNVPPSAQILTVGVNLSF